MKKQQQEKERAMAAQGETAAPEFPALPWMTWPWQAWMGAFGWYAAWSRACDAVFEGMARGAAAGSDAAADAGERRHPGGDWMPRIEATVIPLRRRTDPPGAQGTRVSMRMAVPPLPWAGAGANVIAMEAIVTRNKGEASGAAKPTGEDDAKD